MRSSHRIVLVLAAAAVLAVCGCASIISGRTATVNIDSNPSQAHVVIRDKHGKEVITTHTPAAVELKRKDRFIWPARYTATIEKEGFQPKTVAIKPTINPWIVGNVVVGGVIGLAVDSATGAAWKPKVAQLHPTLDPIYTAQATDGHADESASDVRPAAAIY